MTTNRPTDCLSELNLLLVSANFNLQISKIIHSRDEIVRKHPGRVDLINSMNDSIEKLTEAYTVFKSLEMGYRLQSKRCFDLEMICLNKQAEIVEREKIIRDFEKTLPEYL